MTRGTQRMKSIRCQPLLLVVSMVLLLSPGSHAAEGGYSNYIPGTYGDFAMAVEPETKLTFRNDFYYYGADTERAILSGLAVADLDLDFTMNFTTALYKPDVKLFGAQYAFGVFLPIVRTDIDASVTTGGPTLRRQDNTTGLGDVVLIPMMLFWNRGNLHMSVAEYIVTPTADYDSSDLANSGLNYFSFDTNFALTYLNMENGRDVSFNVGYIYNTENSDTDYQTGQEIHVDAVFNQFFSESFAVGLHGFYLKQITGDSGAGAVLGDFKAEAAGIGPALLWNTKIGKRPVSFIAKWLNEFDVERRLEGDHFMVSAAFGF